MTQPNTQSAHSDQSAPARAGRTRSQHQLFSEDTTEIPRELMSEAASVNVTKKRLRVKAPAPSSNMSSGNYVVGILDAVDREMGKVDAQCENFMKKLNEVMELVDKALEIGKDRVEDQEDIGTEDECDDDTEEEQEDIGTEEECDDGTDDTEEEQEDFGTEDEYDDGASPTRNMSIGNNVADMLDTLVCKLHKMVDQNKRVKKKIDKVMKLVKKILGIADEDVDTEDEYDDGAAPTRNRSISNSVADLFDTVRKLEGQFNKIGEKLDKDMKLVKKAIGQEDAGDEHAAWGDN